MVQIKRQKSVFILEDEKLVVWCIRRALEKRGYSVTEAATLEEGRRITRRRIYDIYIIDVYLPDGSGLDLIDEIRLHYRKAKIFILTAYHHVWSVKKKLIEKDVEGLIKKPFKLEQLVRFLEEKGD